MTAMQNSSLKRLMAGLALACASLLSPAAAETCSTASEMDAATKSALQQSAAQLFSAAASGNVQSLLRNSIPEIAGNAGGVEGVLNEHRANLAGATASPRNTYLLEAGGNAPLERAEFFCGVFNSPAKVGFTLQNLPAGRYGLVILDVQNSKMPYFYSFLLRQEGGAWKMAALFPRNRQLNGRDAQFYWQQARDFKSQGQRFNAWFHYLIARELAAPLPFMGTTKLDAFYDEVQQSQPADLPEQNPVPLVAANGKTYQLINMFVLPSEKAPGLDLVIKFQTQSVADTGKAFQDNMAAMKALLQKYPELRTPFQNIVARATEASGQDFGSMMAVKDIK